MDTDFAAGVLTFFRSLDLIATFLWALSGGLLAARRGFDAVGIFTVALVSSTGGGLIRDGLFLQQGPPALVQTPTYLILIAVAVVVVMILGRRLDASRLFKPTVAVIDALGIGAFAVVGMERALAAGLPIPGVMIVGMANAVGGSILRDLVLQQTPEVMKPGVLLAIAALIGCILFLVQLHFGVSRPLAVAVTVAAVFLVRIAALRFRLETRALKAFQDHHAQGNDDA